MANSIKINGKEYYTRPGATDTANLDILFQAVGSAEYCQKVQCTIIQKTDTESLELLEKVLESVQLWANSSSGAVGVLLAYVNHKELSHHEMASIGWLLAGLSELQNALADAGVTLSDSVKNQRA